MNAMKVLDTAIPDVKIIEPTIFKDERGWFMESWNSNKFNRNVIERVFVQDNHSYSLKNVLRGLHFQYGEHAQGKLVRCVRGAVYDVAVDIRLSSPTFGKWVGVELSESNHRQFWIPEGFAHGFLTLSESAEFLYKTSGTYCKEAEGCIAWNDPDLNINWPTDNAQLSEKDLNGISLKNYIRNGKV